MKQLILLIALSSFSLSNQAQQQHSDATLTYQISVSAPGNEQISKAFSGATYTVYLKRNQSRTVMQSNLGVESTIYDGNTGKAVILKEYSGQKLMITLTRQNWEQKNQLFSEMQFSTDGNSGKIGDFEVYKAISKINGELFEVFYSKATQLPNTNYHNAFSKLNGVPVKYELKSNNITFTYTLSSISFDIIPSTRFEFPKTGYRVMSYDENLKLKSGDF